MDYHALIFELGITAIIMYHFHCLSSIKEVIEKLDSIMRDMEQGISGINHNIFEYIDKNSYSSEEMAE